MLLLVVSSRHAGGDERVRSISLYGHMGAQNNVYLAECTSIIQYIVGTEMSRRRVCRSPSFTDYSTQPPTRSLRQSLE